METSHSRATEHMGTGSQFSRLWRAGRTANRSGDQHNGNGTACRPRHGGSGRAPQRNRTANDGLLARRVNRNSTVSDNGRGERRKKRRDVHIDRRKSGVDVMEHVTEGVRTERVRATADDVHRDRGARRPKR